MEKHVFPYKSVKILFGPVVEEGLVIGISIIALLIVITIVLSILDWVTGLFNDFIQIPVG